MANKTAGYMLKVEGGGKAISYHCEQRQEFIDMNKHFIHYLNDDFSPVMIDGKEKTGLKAKDKLTLIGYTD